MSSWTYRTKNKQKTQENYILKSVITFILSIIILYSLLFPSQFGIIGQKFKSVISYLFGQGMYLIPLFVFLYSFKTFKKQNVSVIQWTISLLFIVLSCVFLSVISKINYGGLLGKFLKEQFFERILGPLGTVIIVILGLIYLISVLLNISLVNLVGKFIETISKDLEEWRSTRELIKKIEVKQKPIVKPKLEKENSEPLIEKKTVKELIKTQPEQSKQEQKEIEIIPKKQKIKEEIQFDKYQLPTLDLIPPTTQKEKIEYNQEDLVSRAALLEQTLSNFNVRAKVVNISPGPVITRFELTPEPGVKVQQITALENDIALAMKTSNIRIIAPVPGKGTVGVEIPNPKTKFVGIREIMESEEFINSKSKLTIALGQTTDGKPYVTDLIPMPHLLIAGATGSGKSVCIHSIITSILFKSRPDEVKFLLIDPKRLELPVYNGIPHLYDPKTSPEKVSVITQPKEAAESLKYLVKVMEKRYEKFAQATVRNIEAYNELMIKQNNKKEFYIVVVIDELADLMLVLPKEIEDNIQRLAQMARAVGIHLVLATQRPSVDVITGVIKANLPSRIALQVLSKVDSRVILDTTGAEDLLGRGDMLFLPTGEAKPIRLQGAYVSEKNVEKIVEFIKKQNFVPEYDDIITVKKQEEVLEKNIKRSAYMIDALELIMERKRISQDLLKARFGSSATASDILSILETEGFIHKPEGTNRWHIFFDKVEEYLKTHKSDANENLNQ